MTFGEWIESDNEIKEENMDKIYYCELHGEYYKGECYQCYYERMLDSGN